MPEEVDTFLPGTYTKGCKRQTIPGVFSMLQRLTAFFLLSMAIMFASHSYAQGQTAKENKKSVIYENLTLRTLSQLYWALSKFDPIETHHIDNFLLINECDLYREFANNEFEWDGMRESAKSFLKENKSNFPVHFELVQQLRLGEYDFETNEFEIWEPYKIYGARRFEAIIDDITNYVCGHLPKYHIRGYPKGLLVELSRPLTLDKIKVPPELAKIYIGQKTASHIATAQKKENKYKVRDIYLVMKMRIFSYQGEVRSTEYHKLTKVLAALEGFEVYGDPKRELLLYSEDYKRKKKRPKIEIEMKRRYQERLKKQMEKKRKALQAQKGLDENTEESAQEREGASQQ